MHPSKDLSEVRDPGAAESSIFTSPDSRAAAGFGAPLPRGEASGGADASRATLSIFSRHMNAQTTAWEKERAALLEQIQALQAKQTP